jgi:hypothetical protein
VKCTETTRVFGFLGFLATRKPRPTRAAEVRNRRRRPGSGGKDKGGDCRTAQHQPTDGGESPRYFDAEARLGEPDGTSSARHTPQPDSARRIAPEPLALLRPSASAVVTSTEEEPLVLHNVNERREHRGPRSTCSAHLGHSQIAPTQIGSPLQPTADESILRPSIKDVQTHGIRDGVVHLFSFVTAFGPFQVSPRRTCSKTISSPALPGNG